MDGESPYLQLPCCLPEDEFYGQTEEVKWQNQCCETVQLVHEIIRTVCSKHPCFIGGSEGSSLYHVTLVLNTGKNVAEKSYGQKQSDDKEGRGEDNAYDIAAGIDACYTA